MNKESVAVCVVTYNSSETVLETLDSILQQSYGSENIELIIADDASTDNTVEVIENWLSDFQHWFYCVQFIRHKKNGGLPKNTNAAWKASHSEWVKILAGDDLLAEHGIDDYVRFKNDHPQAQFIFGRMETFSKDKYQVKPVSGRSWTEFFTLGKDDQYQYMLTKSFNIAPVSFLNRNALEKVGYCDERYRLCEDIPLWLKLLKQGDSQFYCLNKVTVKYRVGDSISNQTTQFVNLNFKKEIEQIYSDYVYPNLTLKNKWLVVDRKLELMSLYIIYYMCKNKPCSLSSVVYNAFALLRPRYYLSKLGML